MLLAAGWDHETLDNATLAQTRDRLFDPVTEMSKKRDPDINKTVSKLRKAGLKVDFAEKTAGKTPTRWVKDLWDAQCLHPGWVTSVGGQRSMVLVSHTSERAEQASSLFIHDLWSGLGDEPEARLPVFRRMSLVALMSPETLNRYTESVGASTDLLVIHGGLLDPESLYQNFSYLAAVRSLFKGFLLYEAVVPQGEDPSKLANVARRSGFPLVLGVS